MRDLSFCLWLTSPYIEEIYLSTCAVNLTLDQLSSHTLQVHIWQKLEPTPRYCFLYGINTHFAHNLCVSSESNFVEYKEETPWNNKLLIWRVLWIRKSTGVYESSFLIWVNMLNDCYKVTCIMLGPSMTIHQVEWCSVVKLSGVITILYGIWWQKNINLSYRVEIKWYFPLPFRLILAKQKY